MIELRPHHALCIHFFEGKGYNREFTIHMQKVIKQLKRDTLLRLTIREDTICSECPNALSGGCSSAEKVTDYDRAVLKYIGLPEGAVVRYGDLEVMVEQKLIKNQKMAKICADCKWADLCHSHNREMNGSSV